jgi:hypothetical protein
MTSKLLYFGPITLVIEWCGILLGIHYLASYNTNKAISTVSTAQSPLPLIFGLTLTTVGITYFLFGLSLKHISRRIPYTAFIAGIAFTLTGWIPYTGNGGTGDLAHNLFNCIAVAGYIAMIWFLREHPLEPISKASQYFFYMLVVTSFTALISLYILHRFVTYAQLTLLVLIQIWTLVVVWHTKRS